jgi:heme-degrading monooxygenase HmoA
MSSLQAVEVVFDFGDDFDRERVAKVAHEARSMFEGMPGLRSKVFTVDEAARRATNFYVWDSAEQAKAFFGPELTARVTSLYGVAPTIRYADVLQVVDNTHAGSVT